MKKGSAFIFLLTLAGHDVLASGWCINLLSRFRREQVQAASGPEVKMATDTDEPSVPTTEPAHRPFNRVTSEFIGYLGTLLENNVIGDKELAHLISSLEKGSLSNPISEEGAQINSSLHIHREGLASYIESGQVDKPQLLKWAQTRLEENGRVQVRRNDTRTETQVVYQPMTFNRVEPGEFEMGEEGKKIKVTISKPFEMMTTPVTQKQWSMIMEENPSHFVDGEHTIVMTFQGKQIKLQPDNPVEQVSWEDAQKYIARLNELSEKDDPRLYQFIPDHKKGDQYRLPTEAEWEYIARDRGRANGDFHFGNDKAGLKDHAWYWDNANQMTHPVAQLKPLIVDGKAFYDVHGNVSEWTEDSWDGTSPLRGGNDPVATKGSVRVFRGGAWASGSPLLRSTYRHGYSPGDRHPDIGFRLVRVRP